MSDFPALIPSSRTFTPEGYAGAAATSLKGASSRVAHSTAAFGAQLRLSFIGLTEAERFAIEAHYHGQQGGFLAFALPAETFSGVGSVISGAASESIITGVTYSQSSTYVDNDPADEAGMTDGSYNTGLQTGTDNDATEWVKMDFGSPKAITKVVVGSDYDTVLPGDWGPTYTEDKDVEGSTNGTTWATLFNTGTFTQGIQEYAVDVTVRYVRIVSSGWLAITEFYAMGGSALWRYSAPPEIEDFCGPHYDVTVSLESVTS